MVRVTWVATAVVLAIHDAQIAEHGGSPGLRDQGLLESALARPQNLAAYGQPDLAALAAAYAFGIARNHPFVDGNKRVSAVVSRLFLRLNGHDIAADQATRLQVWLGLAAGRISEEDLAGWFREHIRAL
ncbi:MAG: type II toxin-antitoxin system death-on-curing family toxin [Pseudomonadota bacterium]|nr:type II toxin-antitoxin system death-on-curing family toxin [Pseudomonadota bacterium]